MHCVGFVRAHMLNCGKVENLIVKMLKTMLNCGKLDNFDCVFLVCGEKNT